MSTLSHAQITEHCKNALMVEVALAPKPGLVDSLNNGAHNDMDLALFRQSIDAITPYFEQFYQAGITYSALPDPDILLNARGIGIACEASMFAATAGVNTHKGGIFSLGLLCIAAGVLKGRKVALTRNRLMSTVQSLCQGLTKIELKGAAVASSVGERLFQQHGLLGARGEAESGFQTVRDHGLPIWDRYLTADKTSRCLLHCLLSLIAHNPDTNLVSRGGIAGLMYAQDYAKQLLQQGWDEAALMKMDADFITRHLSPGGSADLLSVTYVLGQYPK